MFTLKYLDFKQYCNWLCFAIIDWSIPNIYIYFNRQLCISRMFFFCVENKKASNPQLSAKDACWSQHLLAPLPNLCFLLWPDALGDTLWIRETLLQVTFVCYSTLRQPATSLTNASSLTFGSKWKEFIKMKCFLEHSLVLEPWSKNESLYALHWPPFSVLSDLPEFK